MAGAEGHIEASSPTDSATAAQTRPPSTMPASAGSSGAASNSPAIIVKAEVPSAMPAPIAT